MTGPGGIYRLEPKVMLVLVCLADHAGQMVPKERLMASVWADTAVGDDVLTRAISELRRLFEDDPKQPRVIETIPKAGYRLIAPITRPQVDVVPAPVPAAETEKASAAVHPRNRRLRVAVLAGSLILITGVVTWLLRPQHRTETRLLRVAPLTVLPGHEQWPTFSPDGGQVAFEWDGENGDNADIYIKMVDSSEVRRLTSVPAGDRAPSWSPDGRQIAYIRIDPESEGGRIHLVSPLGGTDLKLSDVPVSAPLAWSPDGRYIAAQRVVPPKGIYLIPVDGGEPRPIIASRPPRTDSAPAFSPDGRRLAYGSCATGLYGCDVYVLELDAALALVLIRFRGRFSYAV